MNKPALTLALTIFIMISMLGSIDFRVSPSPSCPPDKAYTGVCGAPPDILASIIDNHPLLKLGPTLVRRSESIIDAPLANILSKLPDMPTVNGYTVEDFIANAAPHFL